MTAVLAGALPLHAQRVDFNLPGRQPAQVTETGYTPWAVKQGVKDSLDVESAHGPVRIVIANGPLSAGKTLRSNWWKDGVNKYSKLVGDGVAVYLLDANNNTPQLQAGSAEITITLKGLAEGEHSIMAYHNNTDGYTAPPLNVYVDGEEKATGVAQTSRAQSVLDAGMSYVKFHAKAGKDVVVAYRSVPEAGVDYTSGYRTTTVFINSIVLDEPNPKTTAQHPSPANYDLHADADGGSIVLKWKPALSAVRHHVYLGTSPEAMEPLAVKDGATDTTQTVEAPSNLDTYYWRVDEEDAQGNVYTGDTWVFRPRHLAFPGAEGYGRFAIGGRGGTVYHVTTLDDNGDDTNPLPGSLRYGVKKVDGPRTIVFDVAGFIRLKSRLTCSDPYVTIAGQTAPGNGITLRDKAFGMASDGITRFLRLRLGGGDNWDRQSGNPATSDGMGMAGNDNAIMDHCSISWTIDEGFSSRNANSITLQRTLISEALNYAGHNHYWEQDGRLVSHGYAATIGGGQAGGVGSFHHNLLAHNAGRNWSVSGGLDGAGFYDGHHDIFNNVVYNWASRATDGGSHEVNFVGNYYKMGPATTKTVILQADLEGTGKGSQSYYVKGNIRENLNGSQQADAYGNTYKERLTNGQVVDWTVFHTDKPFFDSYATVESARAAYKNVLSDVGANEPALDNHDTRMVDETIHRTTSAKGWHTQMEGIIDMESESNHGFDGLDIFEACRPEGFDTDQDGMPDWWEEARGTDPATPDNNGDPDQDGYTNLEDYLNYMAEPHFDLQNGKPLTLNLKAYFAGYVNNPKFDIASASDDVTCTPGQHEGEYVFGAIGGKGIADFAVTASDDDNTGTYTRTFHFYHSDTPTAITATSGAKSPIAYEVFTPAGVKVASALSLASIRLAPGIYIVKSTTASGQTTAKTVINR